MVMPAPTLAISATLALGLANGANAGAFVGIGTQRRGAHWRTIGAIVASWLVLLPAAAALAAMVWLVAAR